MTDQLAIAVEIGMSETIPFQRAMISREIRKLPRVIFERNLVLAAFKNVVDHVQRLTKTAGNRVGIKFALGGDNHFVEFGLDGGHLKKPPLAIMKRITASGRYDPIQATFSNQKAD